VSDAVVIGAGPNGLVAANRLADAGWSVTVVESEQEPGGCVRSSEALEPGFVNDHCSSFYPLAAASPAIRGLALEDYGLEWLHGPLALAHPAEDGSCVVLSRDLDQTAASLDRFAAGDGEAWRRLFDVWRRASPAGLDLLATAIPPVRSPLRLLAARPWGDGACAPPTAMSARSSEMALPQERYSPLTAATVPMP
jgi:phytoene dehydrogenase-like protein